MFGNNPSPFGSPPGQPTGFGNPTPAFGSPPPAPFGTQQPSSTPFGGGGTTFGSPPAPSGFGTATTFGSAAPTGFGTTTSAFGGQQQQQQQQPSAFGGGFGSAAPAGFGAAPSTGLFGNTAAPAGGGLFGGGGTSGAFGAPATNTFGGGGLGVGTGFGAATTTGFGAAPAAPSTGLFGAQAPAPAFGTSTFGAPAPVGFGAAPLGGLFGAQAPAPAGGGLFGAPSSGVGGGSKVAPYQVTTRQDGTASIQLHAITAMQQYEGKSFEELRYEDYAQGNKGTGGGAAGATTGAFGGFGAPAPGMFGAATPAPAPFGAPAAGFGGSPAQAPAFGMGGSTFSTTPAPAPTGFGAPSAFGAPGTSLFGGSAAPAPAFGGFGAAAPKPGGLFGSPAPAPVPGTSLFGQSPAPSMFGGGAPAPSTLFGSNPAPAPGLFGNAPAFGSPAPAPTGGLFGAPQPAPAGGLFGAQAPAPLFGGQQAPAPAFGGSLFGGQAPAPAGGLFGPPKPQGTSLFGAPAPGGGLFGAPAPAPAGGYYGAAPVAPQYFASAPINIVAPSANEVLAQQMAAMENQRQELGKLEVWRGKSPDIASVVPASLSESEATTILPYRGFARPYSVSPKSQIQIRPRGFNTLSATKSPPQLSLTPHGRSNNDRVMMSPSTMVTSSVKRLVIRPETMTPKPKLRLQFEESPRDLMNGRASTDTPTLKLPPPAATAAATPSTAPETSPQQDSESHDRQATTPSSATSHTSGLYQREVEDADGAVSGTSTQKERSESRRSFSTRLPKLTKAGYDVSPSMEQLKAMSEADLAAVENFTVFRDGLGQVEWEGAVDIRDVDLDYVVKIEQGECSVYSQDEENGTKPPPGTKLNRPAIITLWNVLPRAGDAPESFIRKIKKVTAKLDADLLSYDVETGEWVFRVRHFSRYGIFESDYDDEDDEAPKHHDGYDVGPAPRTPEKINNADRGDQLATYVSDVDMSEVDYPVADSMDLAEKAYENLSKMIEEAEVSVEDEAVCEKLFPDEVEPPMIRKRTQHGVFPHQYDFPVSWSGISSKIKTKAQVKPAATTTDASLCFGRSFGVCWHPDGSFYRPSEETCGFVPLLVRSRPIFTNAISNHGLSKQLLETQLANSVKPVPTESPLFTLPPGYDNSGTKSSHKALSKAVMEFSAGSNVQNQKHRKGDPEEALVGHRAFELLSCLVDTNDSDASATFMDVSNRLEAVSQWIVDACRNDVDANIEYAKRRKDIATAIFAAVSGGDLERACSMASSNGFLHLASMLMAGRSDIDDIRSQVSEWRRTGIAQKIPPPLLRVYSLLGGEFDQVEKLDEEENTQLDWRRHFALRLLFASGGSNLADVFHKFTQDVNAAAVAYPYPRYSTTISQAGVGEYQTECTLYRLLQLFDKPSQCLLSHLIQPAGHTASLHDFTLAFHLASTVSATGACHQLTPMEEARLVDAYCAQLLDEGNWEWAVFVQLCSLTTSSADNPKWRLCHAKELVLVNFSPTHPHAKAIQSFLETKLGVPSAWFEEAVAMRCGINGDVLGYVLHASAFSMDKALETLERVFLPNLFFMSSGDIEASMKLLQTCDSYGSPLAEALIDFFELSNDVRRISQSARDVIVEHLPFLIDTARGIEATLLSYQTKAKSMRPMTFSIYPNYRMVPMESFLAEAMAGLSLLKLQIRALEVNLPIPGVSETTRMTSTEGFSIIGNVNSDFSDEKLLRGYIDGEM